MLLGGIPNSSSEKTQASNPNFFNHSPLHVKTSSLSSKLTHLHNSSQPEEHRSFSDGLTTISKCSSGDTIEIHGKLCDAHNCHETHTVRLLNDVNLSDDNSLRLAFEDLSFKDGVSRKPSLNPATNYNRANPDHRFLLDRQYKEQLNNSMKGLHAIEMSKPPMDTNLNGANISRPIFEAYQPLMSVNEVVEYNGKMNGPEHWGRKLGNMLGEVSEQWPPVYSGAMTVSPAMCVYPYLPTTQIPKIDLTASAYQQQYYLDAQPPAYISSSHQGKTDIRSSNQQHLYLQQLQNQGSLIHQLPAHANTSTQSLTGNTMQSYFEMPTSQMIKDGSQNSFWNGNAGDMGYNLLNICIKSHGIPLHQKLTSAGTQPCPANYVGRHKVSEYVGKQYFPEKILTRSDGVNSLRLLGPNSVASNQSTPFADKNGRGSPDGHASHPHAPINGSLHLVDQSLKNSSLHISDLHPLELIQVKSIDEAAGNISSMEDQHSCCFLLRKFTEGPPEDVAKIFAEIFGHIFELMTDPSGNYLVQKLLEVCNEDQRMHILHAITRKTGDLFRISCDMHGTRVVQKLIETLKTTEQFSMIVSSLKPGVLRLIKDINGSHVAQRCLQHLSPEHNEFLFDAAVDHCLELAADRQGCCVLQKCLHHSNLDQKHKLMSAISFNSFILSQNPYGNYVVQYVLDQKVPCITALILHQLEGNHEYLSKQKYSSNVIEKCLKHSSEDERVKIIWELMNSHCLLQILQDPYGNYVIQTALKECKGAIHAALVKSIRPHVPALRSNPYGRKVLSCISIK